MAPSRYPENEETGACAIDVDLAHRAPPIQQPPHPCVDEDIFQRRTTAFQTALHRTHRDLDHVRNLFVGEPFHLAQDEHRAKGIWQLAEAVLDPSLQLAAPPPRDRETAAGPSESR